MHTETIIIGGGLLGLATACAFQVRDGRRLVVLEAEQHLAAHQSGHNSGVIHSGIYYQPGSLKARLCAAGREALYRFCETNEVPHERCGKLIVATRPADVERLERLGACGAANGLSGLVRVEADQIRRYEPNATGLEGLWVPETGIVEFKRVAEAYAEKVRDQGGTILTAAAAQHVEHRGDEIVVHTPHGEVIGRTLVNCTGLQSDRVARLCGVRTDVVIVPIRGSYRRLVPGRRDLIRNLLYPVPDPRYPFLGVHFTRRLDGSVKVGPTARVCFNRHGYRPGRVSPRDLWALTSDPRFWRMALGNYRAGVSELRRSTSRVAFARDLRALVPGVAAADLEPAGCGIRAQAVDRRGRLLDDFHIVRDGPFTHVINAPSPAATASLAIGEHIARNA